MEKYRGHFPTKIYAEKGLRGSFAGLNRFGRGHTGVINERDSLCKFKLDFAVGDSAAFNGEFQTSPRK